MKKLLSVNEVSELIKNDGVLVLFGEEELLSQLPKGKWIGGTMPYFLTLEKALMDKTKIWVSDFTELSTDSKISAYSTSTINQVCVDGFENGFTFLLLPALTEVHAEFSLHAPHFENQFVNPLGGLITGVDLTELGNKTPKTVTGNDSAIYSDMGVALHIKLPSDKVARLEIVNIFEKDASSPTLEFEESSFNQSTVLVDGVKQNFVQFMKNSGRDIKFPLVDDHGGALVNSSFLAIDKENDQVKFYAPIFKGNKYYFAKPFTDYVQEFDSRLPKGVNSDTVSFACNCILNYLYGELEGKSMGFEGPIAFGEIAYQLVNQTFTYLVIE